MTGAAAGQGAAGYLPYVGGILIALFGGGGVAALIKVRQGGPNVIVSAAQGAVIVQAGVIDDLQDQLADAREQIKELRGHIADLSELRKENRRLRARQAVLESENAALERRVRELEEHQEG